MKHLMVLTSHDQLGNTGRKTGFWLEEFAAPYFTFLDAGATVTLASPRGGQPPIDPVSDTPEGQTDATRRFKEDPTARAARREHLAPCRRQRGRLRRGLLSRRPRPDVGPGRGPAFDRPRRGLLERRQAGRSGLPCARRAPPRPDPGAAAREGYDLPPSDESTRHVRMAGILLEGDTPWRSGSDIRPSRSSPSSARPRSSRPRARRSPGSARTWASPKRCHWTAPPVSPLQ